MSKYKQALKEIIEAQQICDDVRKGRGATDPETANRQYEGAIRYAKKLLTTTSDNIKEVLYKDK